jgi:hypothetical protein
VSLSAQASFTSTVLCDFPTTAADIMLAMELPRPLNVSSYVLQLKNSRNGMLRSYNTYVCRSRAKFHEIFSNLDKTMCSPPLSLPHMSGFAGAHLLVIVLHDSSVPYKRK